MPSNHQLPDLHLEITSKCTLACPACPRTYAKGEYKVCDLDLSTIQNICSSGLSFKAVSLCGNHGDPIYHSDFHEVLLLLQSLPGAPRISIATNGSFRNSDWWQRTAEILRPQDEVIFGIDGTKETSKLYRKNSDWDSIVTGIKTLRAHGSCLIRWQWILFNFNETQMSEAALIADELGINQFMLIGSARHDNTDPYKPNLTLDQAMEQFAQSFEARNAPSDKDQFQK